MTVGILCLFHIAYGLGFIFRSSAVVEGKRYFTLFDDAMISMCYAQNWVQGRGLVWNPGERVEGYTNLLWVVVMAIAHLPGASPSMTCLAIQLLGIPTLLACLIATAKLARACRLLPTTAVTALMLVALQYSLLYFSLFGMETGFLCVLVTFGLASAVDTLRRGVGRLSPLLWFVPAVLVRLDALLLAVLVGAALVVKSRAGRARPVCGLIAVVAVIGLHCLWRYSYYGEWLPNTYYLKATGWPLAYRLSPGFIQLGWALLTLGLPLIFALFVLLKPTGWHFLLLGAFVVQVGYQTYVGGDTMPLSRFLVPTMPALFVVAAQGLHRVCQLAFRHGARTRPLILRFAALLVVVAAMNAVHWDHFLLLARPQTTEGNEYNIRFWKALDRVADPDATVAVGWAGVIPYYSQRGCFDILGRCDRHIARLPAWPGIRKAGHNKMDFNYTFNLRRPDIVLHAYAQELLPSYHAFREVIDGQPLPFFVRRDSEHVRGGEPITFEEARRLIGLMR